jgi:hypothetical protein
VFDNVLAATTVTDLEEPIDKLTIYARNTTLLSDLWAIVTVARERIATLQRLSDLGEEEDISQDSRNFSFR